MSEMEERLNALLSNPQLMQQIASMAQTMGAKPTEEPEAQSPSAPSFDPRKRSDFCECFEVGSLRRLVCLDAASITLILL